MRPLSKNALRALRFLGIGKRRIRELFEWAVENPDAARYGLMAGAGFCRHRARVLKARRWALNKTKRIARMYSAARELEGLASAIRKGTA